MATTPVPVLSLDSLADLPVVVINDTPYELLTTEVLTPINGHRLARLGRRELALRDKVDLTPDEEAELERLPGQMCRLVLDAPAEVIDALTDLQRMKVLQTFLTGPRLMALLAEATRRVEAVSETPATSTGDTLPAGSPDSTQAPIP